MDDDEDVGLGNSLPPQPSSQQVSASAKHQPLRQGQYRLPSGLFWVWHRSGICGRVVAFSMLSIRDSAANNDLIVASFDPIKGVSQTKGRRSNTILPAEDLTVLKAEFASRTKSLHIQSGSLLESHCVPSNCSLRELELQLGLTTPWDIGEKHRLEIPSSSSKRIGAGVIGLETDRNVRRKQSTNSLSLSLVPTDLASIDTADIEHVAPVEYAFNCIGAALSSTNDPTVLEQFDKLKGWLKVACLDFIFFGIE